ncbi:hypothetical protein Ahy_A06g027695 [Arachis hypogaea]|uniref:RNase H type-1 domain-containing protein n=1 Tax=Arachis hypogaea TaxID=3818 RepID=A0A445CPJ3_ARAHY|nr:hypothetical protein Ahy_A06g027695 [Arachis hypogaea]
MVGHEKSACPKISRTEANREVANEKKESVVVGGGGHNQEISNPRNEESSIEIIEKGNGKQVMIEESDNYGPWMVVQRPTRGRRAGKGEASGSGEGSNGMNGRATVTGTRYDVLQEKDNEENQDKNNGEQNHPEKNLVVSATQAVNKTTTTRNTNDKNQRPIDQHKQNTLNLTKITEIPKAPEPVKNQDPSQDTNNDHNQPITMQDTNNDHNQPNTMHHQHNWTISQSQSQDTPMEESFIPETGQLDEDMGDPPNYSSPNFNSIESEIMVDALEAYEKEQGLGGEDRRNNPSREIGMDAEDTEDMGTPQMIEENPVGGVYKEFSLLRGAASRAFCRTLKEIIRQNNPDIVILMETRCSGRKALNVVNSIEQAEMLGILHGLRMAWDMGMRRVIVENDAEEVLRSITKERRINQIHHETIREIVKMKQRLWELEFCHIYREANRSANWLEREAWMGI